MSNFHPTSRLHTLSVFVVCFLVMLVATLTWTLNRGHPLDAPPAPLNTDGVFYDNIAFHLDAGDGFRVDFNAQPWRSSYINADAIEKQRHQYQWLMPRRVKGLTALRSPGYPYVLAAIYCVIGRRYDVVRIFGCVFVSFGIALLLTLCESRWGFLPALIAATTLVFDYAVMQSAGTIATESFAIAIFATTFILAVRAFKAPSFFRWSVCGASFAALMLTRGIWSLGLLIMICLLVLCALLPQLRHRIGSRSVGYGALFLIVAMVVASPWWIRNCVVTEHFQPFGTAGACGFVAAYCDESLADHGQWQSDVFNRNQAEVKSAHDTNAMELAHLEYKIGQASLRKSVAWSIDNWSRIPELFVFRAISHWGFFNPSVPIFFQAANLWLVVVGLIGCFVHTGRLRRVFIFVLILDSVLVMLTWEHLGRYAIPIRPILHIGNGLVIAAVIDWSIKIATRGS